MRGELDQEVWKASARIAEVVADTESPADIGQVVIDALERMVGCDLGSIITAAPGEEWSFVGQIGDNGPFARNYWSYASAFTVEEVQRLAGRFSLLNDVFQGRRRDSLGIFSDYLHPRGLRNAIVQHWSIDGRATGIGLTRSGSSFTDRERQRLDAIFPHLKCALRARAWLIGGADAYPGVGKGGPWALTAAQERTMSFVVRGLTNKEVAELLRISPNTVRNTLAEVFRKVGVTSRSELAYIVRGSAGGDGFHRDRRELARQRRYISAVTGGPQPAVR